MRNSKFISISLGANICSKDGSFNYDAIRSISNQLGTLVSQDYGVAAVVGLGGAARTAIEVASKYEKGELDGIKIAASRINASLLIASLRSKGIKALPDVLTLEEDTQKIQTCVGVFGGLKPGLTCDASAALLAKKLRCQLMIVSTVGAIYEKDPTVEKSKPLKTVDRKYLKDLPKGPHVLDPQTCSILLKMPKGSWARIVDYKNIVSSIRDQVGTRIIL